MLPPAVVTSLHEDDRKDLSVSLPNPKMFIAGADPKSENADLSAHNGHSVNGAIVKSFISGPPGSSTDAGKMDISCLFVFHGGWILLGDDLIVAKLISLDPSLLVKSIS
jgi:hypothetical protein